MYLRVCLRVTCGLGASLLLSGSLMVPSLVSTLSKYGFSLKVSAEICRFSGLTYKAMAVGHQAVYLYWATVMSERQEESVIAHPLREIVLKNLVWFDFSHQTLKHSQTAHMQSSHYGLCWLNQIIVPHSSPQILTPEVWSWSSSDPPILRKQPPAMCGLYTVNKMLCSKWLVIIKMQVGCCTCMCV